MFCEQPKESKYQSFPCGKCPACLSKKVNSKYLVGAFAMHEYLMKGQFVTLTYSNEHLPIGLQHSDFAGFMKRLRELDGTTGVKIFVAGEYGEKSGREHFHFLVYNHTFKLSDIQQAWAKGFVYDDTLTDKSLKYVIGYVNKRGYDPNTGKPPPYGRFSKNIPHGLSPEEIHEVCKKGYVKFNGKKYSVPVNWRNKFGQTWKDYYRDRRLNQLKHKKDYSPEFVRGVMKERELRRLSAISKLKKKGEYRGI